MQGRLLTVLSLPCPHSLHTAFLTSILILPTVITSVCHHAQPSPALTFKLLPEEASRHPACVGHISYGRKAGIVSCLASAEVLCHFILCVVGRARDFLVSWHQEKENQISNPFLRDIVMGGLSGAEDV